MEILVGHRVCAIIACVKPHHKLLEDSRLLGLELDDFGLRFAEASIESSLEKAGVEREEASVWVECTFR